MLQDRSERASGYRSRQKTAETTSMETVQPQPEVVENKEQLHPVAKQYVQEVQTFLGALKHYQEHGWKGIQDSWKFPEKAVQEIMVLGHTTEIVLQMTAEEMAPTNTIDTQALHKIHGAPLVTGDGRFLKINNGGKGEMRETSARGLLPALRIDDIPGHADQEYLVQLGETAQLDLLLRDIYSRFLLDVSRRLNYPDVHGTYALKHRLLHDLMYPDSVNKKNVPAPFSAEQSTQDEKKLVTIGGIYDSQLDKFLQAEPFTLLENDAADPENRTVYIDNVYSPDKHNPLRRTSAIGDHLQPSPKETAVPIKPEKIFSLDYIRQATSEIRREALGEWEKYPDKDIKLGVKYRTDPASGVRYPRGADSKEEKENVRKAVEEYALVKERIAALLKEKLRNKDEVESDAATVATVAAAETKPDNENKETAAAKLEAATAEKEALQRDVDRLSGELEAARAEVARLREELADKDRRRAAADSENAARLELAQTELATERGEAQKTRKEMAATKTAAKATLAEISADLSSVGFMNWSKVAGRARLAIDGLKNKLDEEPKA